MELKDVEALLHLFERSSLTEMVIEGSGMRLTFKRQDSSPKEVTTKTVAEREVGEPKEKIEASRQGKLVVRSPCVGVFWSRPKPGADPFVKIGSRVSEGDTLAVVEAMKVLTEVKATSGGIVDQILVQDGQPVDYGQELMVIDPLSS